MVYVNCSRLHSKPNNMTLSAFPEKIPETEKIIFYFSVWPSPNGAPNPTDQYQQLGHQESIVISHLKRLLIEMSVSN